MLQSPTVILSHENLWRDFLQTSKIEPGENTSEKLPRDCCVNSVLQLRILDSRFGLSLPGNSDQKIGSFTNTNGDMKEYQSCHFVSFLGHQLVFNLVLLLPCIWFLICWCLFNPHFGYGYFGHLWSLWFLFVWVWNYSGPLSLSYFGLSSFMVTTIAIFLFGLFPTLHVNDDTGHVKAMWHLRYGCHITSYLT